MDSVIPTVNLRSSGKDSNKLLQQDFNHNAENKISKSTNYSSNSSKMISADSYLPTHSVSTMSSSSAITAHLNQFPSNIPSDTALNLTAITLGNTNNSEALPPPPPSYSRLPPDGHEFPPDYKDPSCTSTSTVYRVSSIHQNGTI